MNKIFLSVLLCLFVLSNGIIFADNDQKAIGNETQSNQKFFETNKFITVQEGDTILKIAIYNEVLSVATAVKGPYKGMQCIFINNEVKAASDNFKKKGDRTIHFYDDGQITTYKNKQTIKID